MAELVCQYLGKGSFTLTKGNIVLPVAYKFLSLLPKSGVFVFILVMRLHVLMKYLLNICVSS